MKKILSILLVALVCVCLLCGCTSNRTYNRGRKINSVNHRGYADAPENTLSAFRVSKEMGFSFVECDISFTKDGVPVLLHDETVDRTSDGSGKIRDLTFDEVRKLDFGSWKSKKYAGEQIPTFAEFVELCQEENLHPYVEIKRSVTTQEVQLLAETAGNLNVTWLCFDFAVLQQLAEIFPDGRFGYLIYFVTDIVLQRAKMLSTGQDNVFLDCCYATLSSSQLSCCKQAGVPLEVWTLNNKNKIVRLDPYISGVTSDRYNAQELFQQL